jgi:hypothetical protein
MSAQLVDPKEPVVLDITGSKVRYFLRVPKVADRHKFSRAVAEEGGQTWTAMQLANTLRDGLDKIMPDDDEEKPNYLEIVDNYIEGMTAALAVYREEPTRENLLNFMTVSVPDERVGKLFEAVAQHYQPLRGRIADNAAYPDVVGVVAAKMFLVGWEGRPVIYRRTPEGIPEHLLEGIREHEFRAIGSRVSELLSPSEDRAKNSD